ncbi:MAG: hypothetical protein ACLQQ4_05820 [Bacteroidia bacterium]
MKYSLSIVSDVIIESAMSLILSCKKAAQGSIAWALAGNSAHRGEYRLQLIFSNVLICTVQHKLKPQETLK